MEKSKIKTRRMQANYIKVKTAKKPDGEFEFMGSGFTDLNEKPSAQTSSKRYINMKSESKSVTGYDWTSEFTADQIRSEKALDYIIGIGENQLTGDDAETEYVIVDLDKSTDTDNEFEARKFDVAVEVSDFGDEDGEMTVSGNLLAKSDPVSGTFNTETKVFVSNP